MWCRCTHSLAMAVSQLRHIKNPKAPIITEYPKAIINTRSPKALKNIQNPKALMRILDLEKCLYVHSQAIL